MKIQRFWSLLAFSFLSGLLSCLTGMANGGPRARTLDFSYTAVVPSVPSGAERLDVWLPIPPNTPRQTISNVRISAPYITGIAKDAEYGNSILFMRIKNPGSGPYKVNLEFRVTRFESIHVRDGRPVPVKTVAADPLIARFLLPDRLVPLDARIHSLATKAGANRNTSFQKARAIYDYAVGTLKYDKSGTGWGRGDIYHACDARSGNCTDFHALFTGYCRSLGVPAKFEIGFPIPPDRGKGKIGGYHCWAEFYTREAGWIPVDASEANKHPEKKEFLFGSQDADRVLFTVGRDILLNPPQQGDRLNYFIYPYAEIDGKPCQVNKAFSYKDVKQR